jgi:hypothetical protein
MRWYGVFFGCGLMLAACERDYRFDTHARYSAPAGGFDVAIDASGLVKAGYDLSDDSTATVTITSSSNRPAPLRLQLVRRPLTNDVSVVKAAREAGFAPSDEEAAELAHAVGGALSGPKATLMEGQTRSLRVIDVTFVR